MLILATQKQHFLIGETLAVVRHIFKLICEHKAQQQAKFIRFNVEAEWLTMLTGVTVNTIQVF